MVVCVCVCVSANLAHYKIWLHLRFTICFHSRDEIKTYAKVRKYSGHQKPHPVPLSFALCSFVNTCEEQRVEMRRNCGGSAENEADERNRGMQMPENLGVPHVFV